MARGAFKVAAAGQITLRCSWCVAGGKCNQCAAEMKKKYLEINAYNANRNFLKLKFVVVPKIFVFLFSFMFFLISHLTGEGEI